MGGGGCDVTGSKEAYQGEFLHISIPFLSCSQSYAPGNTLLILEQQVPKVIPDLEI